MGYGFQKLLSDIMDIDRAEQAAEHRRAQASTRTLARDIRRRGNDLAKSVAPLVADVERICREQRSMTKSIRANATARRKAQEAARPVLGALLIKAVNDAVVSGRLSGSAAQDGLKALGLGGADAAMHAKLRQVADAAHKLPAPDNHKVLVSSLASMPIERQRAAVDLLLRQGKLTGTDAEQILKELKKM